MGERTASYAASTCSTTSGEGQPADQHHTDKNTSGAKRRASRAGTRSVSTLTPAQLQRKRANDREAQRAIRQRNKEHIDSLERRIAELSIGNVDAATLVQLRQRVKELEDDLSKANETLAASRSQQISTHPVWQARSNGDLVHPQASYNHPGVGVPRNADYRVAPMPGYHGHSASYGSNHMLSGESEDNKEFLLSDDADLQRAWGHPTLDMDNVASLSFSPQAQYVHQVPAFYSATYNSGTMGSSAFMNQPSMHAFEIPIRYAPPTGLVDHILISIIQTHRSLRPDGSPQIPPPIVEPHMGGLVHRDPQPSRPSPILEPISAGLTQLLRDHSPHMNLPETVACLYVLHTSLQWQTAPNPGTYARVPEWFRPRAVQTTELHPMWVSHLAWPLLREKVIAEQATYATAELSQLCVSSLNINWPHAESEVLALIDGEVRATPAFQKHIYQLENWTLGSAFWSRYPELQDCCTFSDAYIHDRPAPVKMPRAGK